MPIVVLPCDNVFHHYCVDNLLRFARYRAALSGRVTVDWRMCGAPAIVSLLPGFGHVDERRSFPRQVRAVRTGDGFADEGTDGPLEPWHMCARRQNMRGDSAILLALQEDFARLSHPAFIRAHGWGPWVRHGNRRRTNCTSSFSTPTLGRGPSLDYGPCALTLHYDTRTALPPSATYPPFIPCLDGLPEPTRGASASVITVLSLWLDCVHVLLNLLLRDQFAAGLLGSFFVVYTSY